MSSPSSIHPRLEGARSGAHRPPRAGRARCTHGPIPGILLVGTILASLAQIGCQETPPSPVAAPPPSVVATLAESRPVDEEVSFVGRILAVDRVELRARVQGFLLERRFTEGERVKAGDVLFLIEPDQYAALVQQREADLEKARADQLNTSAQLQRGKELLAEKNIAQARVDELQAADSMARASIAQAEAALASAKLDLGYTRILSPIDGWIGLANYTVGNLVGPESGTLATIVSRDPIYLEFPLTHRDLVESRRTAEKRGHDLGSIKVLARLADGSLYPHPGRLDFMDVTTDAQTDSVTLRASLPNPDGVLVDRQYVGVLLQIGTPEMAILVPQSALQFDQQGTYVLVIDADSKAQVRRIEPGPQQGQAIVVRKGLEAGERVITQGIQKVRAGQVVNASPSQVPSAGGATP